MANRNRRPTPVPTFTDAEVARFWATVEVGPGDPETACWLWQGGHRDHHGYGNFRGHATHRVSWALSNGPIPDGLIVCHKCDNPPCVRPSHLFVGTIGDNTRDMVQKGRAAWQGRPRKTHCVNGHEYTPENSVYYASPSKPATYAPARWCRTCKNRHLRELDARRRALASQSKSDTK